MTTPTIRHAEPRWELEPFTDVRYVGWYDCYVHEHATYRAALILVYDGQAVAVRLSAVVHTTHIDTLFAKAVGEVVDRLAALSIERRLRFFAIIAANEMLDPYQQLEKLEDE